MSTPAAPSTSFSIQSGQIALDFLPTLHDPTDLRIPGPTPLPPAVVEAMTHPMVPHLSARLQALFDDTRRFAREFHRTDGEVYLWPGTGSAGWEISLVNLLEPGDAVLAAVGGDFADRFAQVAVQLGLDTRRVDVPWGQAVTADVVRKGLEANPTVRAVIMTHNETSTGVTNPLAEVGAVVREHGGFLLVDSVSGAGALPIEMDAWGVDVVSSGSQKAWMCPPGLTIVAFSPRALDRAAALTGKGFPRFVFDLARTREAAANGSTAGTTPLSLLYALRTALELMVAEGVDQVWDRHARLGEYARRRIADLGLHLYADQAYASNSVTAFLPPEGMTSPEFQQAVRQVSGIEIATGQAHIRDKVNRVGHMGWTHTPDLDRCFAAMQTVIETRR
jgi:aspartate aminotransferase-like enzyme